MLSSLHFSCNWRTENFISVVDRLDLNLNWYSGYTLSASFWNRGRITLAKALPQSQEEEFPSNFCSPILNLCSYINFSITHVLWHHTFPSHLTKMSCRWGNKHNLQLRSKSAGMTSLPVAFQGAIIPVALLNSSVVGSQSRSSITGRLPMLLSAWSPYGLKLSIINRRKI